MLLKKLFLIALLQALFQEYLSGWNCLKASFPINRPAVHSQLNILCSFLPKIHVCISKPTCQGSTTPMNNHWLWLPSFLSFSHICTNKGLRKQDPVLTIECLNYLVSASSLYDQAIYIPSSRLTQFFPTLGVLIDWPKYMIETVPPPWVSLSHQF